MAIDEGDIARAFAARSAHIRANATTITPKAVRRLLEGDLNIGDKALDGHKSTIAALLEALMATNGGGGDDGDGGDEDEDEDEEDEDEDDDDDVDDEEEEDKVRRPVKKAKTTPTISGDVAKYRDACKRAGITAFQGVLMRTTDEKARVDAMSALLSERGLSIRSAPSEFERVRAKLELEKDMDGIDTSNIVKGGRRRTAVYGTTNYAQLEASSEDEDEDEDKDEDATREWRSSSPSSRSSASTPPSRVTRRGTNDSCT